MSTLLKPTCKTHHELSQLTRIAEQGPEAVTVRLAELEREWTSGRLVKAVTGVLLLAGLALTAWVSPWWLVLVAVAGVVLLQYLFRAHSWLAELFIRCGYRTGAQIEDERIALRVLRGDFRHLPTLGNIEDRDAITRMEWEGGPSLEPAEDMFDAKDAASRILASTPNRTGVTAA